jgi:hypothetical protein
MACDKPTGDCTNVSPCGSGCGCSGSSSSYCPTTEIDCGGVEPGFGYGATDNMDPAASVEMRSCSGNAAESVWIYPSPGAGHSLSVLDCDGNLIGYAANTTDCVTAATVVLPRCQDVSLTPGVYEHATIVINSEGCITAVTSGEPELYTPDECCGGTSTSGGTPGPRGEKGEPGAAATVAVEQTIGTDTVWSVQNVGTSSAAVFRFTAPAPASGSTTTSGVTGTLNGFTFDKGLVKAIPSNLVTSISAQKGGTKASLFQFIAVPDVSNLGDVDVTLNLDGIYSALTTDFTAADSAQSAEISDLSDTVIALQNSVTAMMNTLTTQQNTLSNLQTSLADTNTELETLQDEHAALRAEFDAYVAAHP